MPAQEALIRQLYVRINGTPLDTEVMNDLFRVEVETSLSLPDLCTLGVHDQNARWTNADTFPLGAEIRVGVANEQGQGETVVFIGEITGLAPEFGEGMVVDLIVRAYDRSHRLHRGVHTRTFQNMRDSDIVQNIAQAAGLRAEVDATSTTHEHVYQDGQTDMAFLLERARAIGYDVYVQDRTLYFKRARPNGAPVVPLEWGVQLVRFQPTLTLGSQVSEVIVKGWDPSNKREIVGRAQRGEVAPEIGARRSGGEMAEEAFGSAGDLVVRAALTSQDEADAIAQAILNEHDGAFVEAEGMCHGTPSLRAGCVVELSALGQRFNGRYRVTAARHIWSTAQDYVTWFQVTGRRQETLSALLVKGEPARSFWPLMTGIVTNNNDPENQGRVRVKFPWLDNQQESAWARVVSVGAGDGRGLFCLPEVNDEVLVGFEQGDMSRPIVLGGLWNGVDAPPVSASQAVSGGNVVERVWYTRAGHKLTLHDENPAQVCIETAGGHKVTLDDDQKTIKIETSGGQTLVLDDNGRRLSIKGSGEVAIEAQQNLSIKASANMNIEANGNVTIKGAIIQLNP